MSYELPDAPVDHVLFRQTIPRDAARLCDDRHDLPLRVMIGRIKGRALQVERLLGYKAHVATLGLVSTGMHRHDAALLVATRNAGAFAGSPADFGIWATKHKLKYDNLLTTTLPDGTQWVIWSRDRQPQTKLIPSVCGWNGGFVDFDELLTNNPGHLVVLH